MGTGLFKNGFMARMLLGFGAFITSGTALSQDKPTHSLYISTETMALIGSEDYARKLVEWAGTNVLLVTGKDINELMSKRVDASIVNELQQVYPAFPFSAADKGVIVEMAAAVVIDNAPSSYGFKTGNAAENTHCIIMIPSLNKSSKWFRSSSYLEQTTIVNVKSPVQFWFSMYTAHEAHHCYIDIGAWENLSPAGKQLNSIQREVNADQFTLQVHKNENPDYLLEWVHARSLGSVKDKNWDYIFAGSLSLSGTPSAEDTNAQEILDSNIFIWKKISEHPSLDRGRVILTQANFLFENLGTVKKDSEEFERKIFNAGSKLGKYSHDEDISNKPELRVVETLLQQQIQELSTSNDPYKKLFAKTVPMSLRAILTPEQVYAIVKDIHQKGGFDENPLARKNVELLLEGIAKHAPSLTKQKPSTGLGG